MPALKKLAVGLTTAFCMASVPVKAHYYMPDPLTEVGLAFENVGRDIGKKAYTATKVLLAGACVVGVVSATSSLVKRHRNTRKQKPQP